MKTVSLFILAILLIGIVWGQTPAIATDDQYIKEGNSYLKAGDNAKAIEAYQKAAAISPTPARAYFNICAVMYNVGDTARAKDACKVAIKFDPNKADAYFILGSVLFVDATLGKDGKFYAPESTRETLNKYLELAPNGGHAEDVRAMLKMLN